MDDPAPPDPDEQDQHDPAHIERSLDEEADAPGLGATEAADALEEIPEPDEPA
jgi:hypothetical protein